MHLSLEIFCIYHYCSAPPWTLVATRLKLFFFILNSVHTIQILLASKFYLIYILAYHEVSNNFERVQHQEFISLLSV